MASVSPRDLAVEPLKLPAIVEDRCLALLAKLGLQFGCIDMIVSPAGDWIFLEINQMGQFLWIEEANQDIHLLENFVQLLTGAINLTNLQQRVWPHIRLFEGKGI